MNVGVEGELEPELPGNRFELELEFVQALASPAYLHFLATSARSDDNGLPLLQDADFMAFLKYLRYWEEPEYAKYLVYPHCLYFLNVLIERPAVVKEWSSPSFRNFCHNQQFLAWQHRHAIIYGVGGNKGNRGDTEKGKDEAEGGVEKMDVSS
jgi:mediator of RNA polymerase II transcription subunit 31